MSSWWLRGRVKGRVGSLSILALTGFLWVICPSCPNWLPLLDVSAQAPSGTPRETWTEAVRVGPWARLEGGSWTLHGGQELVETTLT